MQMRIREALTGAKMAPELTTEHRGERLGHHVAIVDGKVLEPSGFEVTDCTEREVGNLPRPWASALLDAL